jgi:voltage-gated potassium channel Kch
MADRLLPGSAKGPSEGQDGAISATVLVIGRGDTESLAQAALLGGQVHVVPVDGLDSDVLARLDPGWVVFPLMAAGFDAANIIETLDDLGFAGRACVMAPRLPNRRMVEIELRSIAPTLHLVLVEAAG